MILSIELELKSIPDDIDARLRRLENNLLPNREDFERINIDTVQKPIVFDHPLWTDLNTVEKRAYWDYFDGRKNIKSIKSKKVKKFIKSEPVGMYWKEEGKDRTIRFTLPLTLNDALELARKPTPETEKAGLQTREDRALWYMRQEPKFFRKCVGYKRYLEIKKL